MPADYQTCMLHAGPKYPLKSAPLSRQSRQASWCIAYFSVSGTGLSQNMHENMVPWNESRIIKIKVVGAGYADPLM